MALKDDFQASVERVKTLPKAPPPSDLLELYALFKQSTEGDATGKRPGMLDVKGRAKFDAWAKVKGQSNDAAMTAYIDKVNRLFAKG